MLALYRCANPLSYSRSAMAYPLLIELPADRDGEPAKYRKYYPQPDVAFLRRDIPFLLVEIDSHSDGSDKNRMHALAACTLRLMYRLRLAETHVADRQLLIMGAFFTREWMVRRFFYFLDDAGKQVCL